MLGSPHNFSHPSPRSMLIQANSISDAEVPPIFLEVNDGDGWDRVKRGILTSLRCNLGQLSVSEVTKASYVQPRNVSWYQHKQMVGPAGVRDLWSCLCGDVGNERNLCLPFSLYRRYTTVASLFLMIRKHPNSMEDSGSTCSTILALCLPR